MRRKAPTQIRLKKFLWVVLPGVLILLAGLAVFLGLSVYRITHPAPAQESANPSLFLLPAQDVRWTSTDGTEFAGWWIAGASDNAPGIILAPGYGMNRADALSLALLLRENGFHLLIYEQRGCGAATERKSTLGLLETDDMQAALDFLLARPGVNRERAGIWGVDIGARAALMVGAARSQVRAIAADSPYDRIFDFLAVKMREELGSDNRLLALAMWQAFRLYMIDSKGSFNAQIPVESLSDRNILFIQGENRPEIAPLVTRLYSRLQPQKEMLFLPGARAHVMTAESLKDYNRHVANFFMSNLPLNPIPPREPR